MNDQKGRNKIMNIELYSNRYFFLKKVLVLNFLPEFLKFQSLKSSA